MKSIIFCGIYDQDYLISDGSASRPEATCEEAQQAGGGSVSM